MEAVKSCLPRDAVNEEAGLGVGAGGGGGGDFDLASRLPAQTVHPSTVGKHLQLEVGLRLHPLHEDALGAWSIKRHFGGVRLGHADKPFKHKGGYKRKSSLSPCDE